MILHFFRKDISNNQVKANSNQNQCSTHLLSIVHTLSSIIQTTVVLCPGALVWYPPSDSKSCGSPLDLLPCAPSSLPLPELPSDDLEGRQEDLEARYYWYWITINVVRKCFLSTLVLFCIQSHI